MKKSYLLTELFEDFIKASKLGHRRKQDGNKIKPQTIENYKYVLKLLQDFQVFSTKEIRVVSMHRLHARQLKVEVNYWKKFYANFSNYLFKVKGCFDNYVGLVFKTIRTFFNYLEKEKLMQISLYKKSFYVRKDEIDIITLMPEQLQFLIFNKNFEDKLSEALKSTKDAFVLGCITGLRCSDIFNLRFKDVEQVGNSFYVVARSIKTNTLTKVKLPDYIISIIERRRKRKTAYTKIFKDISTAQFNKNIRKIGFLAGWTHLVGKKRSRNGVQVEQTKSNKLYRFCDLLSSHTMRRSAITNMLMLGMSEHVVRSISGHSPKSTSFYRYVQFAQSYIDTEINKMHQGVHAIHLESTKIA